MKSYKRFVSVFTVVVMMLVGATLTGCATSPHIAPPPSSPSAATPTSEEDMFWWVYRFRIKWPEGTSPDWAIDLLLAHAVVKPNLEIYAQKLPYWRFHRRAARDASGRQFSFLFYTDAATARALYASLQGSSMLRQLKAQGQVTRIVMDDPDHPVRPGIEDTSDPKWPPTLQRHWPAYIMGVSQMWLGLIDDAVTALPADQRSGENALALYRVVEERLSKIWFKEGQHAFLHHLSAVFGYRELLIVRPVRF